MPEMEKRMRVQLFDKDLNAVSDKVIGQDREFLRGPKEPHDGPLKLEICLFDEKDIDGFIKYIARMRGHLPIATPQKVKAAGRLPKDVQGFRHFIVNQLGVQEGPAQIIEMLRKEGFIFTSLDLLEDMGYPIGVSSIHRKSYKFMARIMKKAKNPVNDKYDPSILMGFKGNKVVAYSGEELLSENKYEKGLEKEIKVPAKARVKFPPYLLQEERNKFRAEMEMLKADPERKVSSFYTRWLSEVAKHSPMEVEFPRSKDLPDAYEKGKTVYQVQEARRNAK